MHRNHSVFYHRYLFVNSVVVRMRAYIIICARALRPDPVLDTVLYRTLAVPPEPGPFGSRYDDL